MAISMTEGYSEQTAGAKISIDLASDWPPPDLICSDNQVIKNHLWNL